MSSSTAKLVEIIEPMCLNYVSNFVAIKDKAVRNLRDEQHQ